MSTPLVAVVIPCYNAGPWIEKTIRSVLDQACPNVDVIVVDDGSTDNSVAVAETFGDQITLLTGPNRGACSARNTGFARAQEQGAKYIVFLDADDYFEGEILAGSVETAERHGADMVLSNMHLEYEGGVRELRQRYADQVAPETFFTGWMQGDYINPPGILWRAAFVAEIGGWDESLARAQDLEITLRALLSRPVIWKNERGAAIHARLNPNSITQNQSFKALDSRFRANSSLVEKARGTSFATAIPLICQELYHVARAAFKSGEWELGRKALRFIRAEGYRAHPGTKTHARVAGLLGLELKVRIWGG